LTSDLKYPDLLSFLDRSNIGNAQTAGLSTGKGSIHETNAQYQWLLTLFYIPYILFEWMALMWKVVPPHLWAFATVLTWYKLFMYAVYKSR
jgi:hypothetical protein